MTDLFGVVANVTSDRVLRTGAKVWLCYCNGDAACPLVIGLSKGGRLLKKYTHFKRLTNFRAKWVPEHLRFSAPIDNDTTGWHCRGVIWLYEDKAEAQRHAQGLNRVWSGVRFFHRDGRLLQDGITERQAFERASTQLKKSRRWFACHKCGFEHEFDGVGLPSACPDCSAWLNIHSDVDGEQPKRLPCHLVGNAANR